MCGIVGGTGKLSRDVIYSHLDLLKRRGPDSQNIVCVNSYLTFGATRLGMTDPSPRSDQPMINEESGNVIVFNGEIYNYKSIRNKLKSLGIMCKTESDTEVLLLALTLWGHKIIPELQGMFAFVFFDKANNKLIMARDYLGKKPLFFYKSNHELFFSSQINFIKKFIKSFSINSQAISMFMNLGYLIDPLTMFNEVKSICPGQFLVIDLNNISNEETHFYTPVVVDCPKDMTVYEVVKESLIERVEGHDAIALSLSGGLDSTVLASISAKLKLPVTSFSMAFSNSDKSKFNSDSLHSKHIAQILGLNHILIEFPKPGKLDFLLQKFISAMDEPNSNPTGLAMMVLYEKISERGFRLALTGDGADEIFGGYERFNILNKYSNLPKIDSKTLQRLIREKNPKLSWLQKISAVFLTSKSFESWLYWHLICGENFFQSTLHSFDESKIKLFGDELSSKFGKTDSATLLYRDLKTWLTMESNKKLDRISMWHSVEARSPFQSESVIGVGLKLMAKNNFGQSKKQIFNEAFPFLRGLPTIQQKTGFISPLGFWLRNNPKLVEHAIYSISKIIPIGSKVSNSLLNSPHRYDFYEMKILWNLIILNYWLENQD